MMTAEGKLYGSDLPVFTRRKHLLCVHVASVRPCIWLQPSSFTKQKFEDLLKAHKE